MGPQREANVLEKLAYASFAHAEFVTDFPPRIATYRDRAQDQAPRRFSSPALRGDSLPAHACGAGPRIPRTIHRRRSVANGESGVSTNLPLRSASSRRANTLGESRFGSGSQSSDLSRAIRAVVGPSRIVA